jgi:hypothetical protein
LNIYIYTATKAGKDSKKKVSLYSGGGRENGVPIHWWWECKLAQPQKKTVWKLIKKLKVDLP